ncbi:MAG: phosphatase PAP2 family protein [Actinobacteria bacterium]|nr:phosphatase PAP2 family protein [Actinomycetota bacterium]
MTTVQGQVQGDVGASPGLAVVSRTGRRRRPSGEAPPLPHPINASGWFYLSVLAAIALGWLLLYLGTGTSPFRAVVRADIAVLQQIEALRTDALTAVMLDLHALGSQWVVRVLRWGTLLALIVLRRFRHLAVFLGLTLVVTAGTATSSLVVGRLRPVDVAILGHWDGYSHPSAPVAALGLSLMGVLYTLVPGGRWRNRAKWIAGAPIVALCIARLYLAVDHPSDILVGAVLGMAVPVVAFRLLTPNEIFPVSYRRGRTAHLDIGGARGDAIALALYQQLGLTVVDVQPFHLEGSAGSTPLLLRVSRSSDGEEAQLFGKLYAREHLRSDRWYKLGRAILYGRLEDEGTFSSVRRLVEYEDYLLRVMGDAGLPVPLSYGFVEITPEREYLMVTEFLAGAEELDDAEVDDAVIDSGLAAVRRMWDTGLAHRDIKPANVLVRNGKVMLIDLAFATVRPSPWRQAVDLTNMMLTLALRSSAEQVYERALLLFSPDDIAEALAASRSVTIPSQLRHRLASDGRNLLARFCALAPERAPISIQRWSIRRIGLTLGVVGAVAFAVGLFALSLHTTGLL